jgi:hypothetical protein
VASQDHELSRPQPKPSKKPLSQALMDSEYSGVSHDALTSSIAQSKSRAAMIEAVRSDRTEHLSSVKVFQTPARIGSIHLPFNCLVCDMDGGRCSPLQLFAVCCVFGGWVANKKEEEPEGELDEFGRVRNPKLKQKVIHAPALAVSGGWSWIAAN